LSQRNIDKEIPVDGMKGSSLVTEKVNIDIEDLDAMST